MHVVRSVPTQIEVLFVEIDQAVATYSARMWCVL
jgi:hypothetical protein